MILPYLLPGNIWQSLEICLVVTVELSIRELLASSDQEVKDAAEHSTLARPTPITRSYPSQMSKVLR